MAAAYTAAWCSQDPALVAAHYTRNGSLTINSGGPAVGRTAITASAQAFMTSLPDMMVAMDSLRVNQGSGRYYWTLTGTNTGPGGTGKAVHISGYEEWTLSADGLIERSLGHFDAVEYARQIRDRACLLSASMRRDFERFGLEPFRRLTGWLEVLGGSGLLVGFKWPVIMQVSSGGRFLRDAACDRSGIDES